MRRLKSNKNNYKISLINIKQKVRVYEVKKIKILNKLDYKWKSLRWSKMLNI